MFDFLPVGSKRLWKISGVGKSTLPIRKCDRLYITRTGDTKIRYIFGITIMKHVKIVESTTDVNGKESVLSISCGVGTKCNVNQGARRAPIMNQSQNDALVKAQATLPPNFMDRCNVNWPVRSTPIVSELQREALVKAQATPPPNFMEGARKRKADTLQDMDRTTNGGEERPRRLMRLVSLEQKLAAY
jgi:hypothetical protein